MRRVILLLTGAVRPLTPVSLLQTIRNDPGMTSTYYANRYFGKDKAMQLNHVLWSVLKRNGKVDLDRADGSDAAPRWYPLFSTPRRHRVRLHNAEEEDLELLHSKLPAAPPVAPPAPEKPPSSSFSADLNGKDGVDTLQLESSITALVHAMPGKDIHYYIMELPLRVQRSAPAAFKRLREAGLLERELSHQGTYVWR